MEGKFICECLEYETFDISVSLKTLVENFDSDAKKKPEHNLLISPLPCSLLYAIKQPIDETKCYIYKGFDDDMEGFQLPYKYKIINKVFTSLGLISKEKLAIDEYFKLLNRLKQMQIKKELYREVTSFYILPAKTIKTTIHWFR